LDLKYQKRDANKIPLTLAGLELQCTGLHAAGSTTMLTVHAMILYFGEYILIRQDMAAELEAEAQVHPIQQGALIKFTTKASASILDSKFSCLAVLAQSKLTIPCA